MIAHRTFPSYAEYVAKQGGKQRVRPEFYLRHLPKNTQHFTRTFRRAARYLKHGAVLCLGARSGAESQGAIEAGFAGSVGIDLHPVGPTVLQGDWHDLPFPPASFANAYTNSLDHCLSLNIFMAEVRRVLVRDGRFYVMATNRSGVDVDEWVAGRGAEALYWETSDQLRDAICSYGFDVKAQWRDGKWGHYVFGVRR